MKTPIDLNRLREFQIVAEARSFSLAARKLGVRRSSVSRSVAALEASLGVQLFSRTTRQVGLTTAGAALYAKLKPQLRSLYETLGSLPERAEEASGQLRIAATVDFGAHLLSHVVSELTVRHPAVRVDVHLSNGIVDLVAGGFDAGIRITATRFVDSTVVARRLGSIELHLFAAPKYLARAGTPRAAEDLVGHQWLAFRGITPAIQPPPPAPCITSDDMLFILESVVSGAGIACIPSFIAAENLAAGRLERVLPRLSYPAGTLYFVHPPARHLPRKVIAFRDQLLDYIAAHPLSARRPPRATDTRNPKTFVL